MPGPSAKSRPAFDQRAVFCKRTPATVKPMRVEAKASAASGVTSSKACCQVADACGTTHSERL